LTYRQLELPDFSAEDQNRTGDTLIFSLRDYRKSEERRKIQNMDDDLIFQAFEIFIESRENRLCRPATIEWYKNMLMPWFDGGYDLNPTGFHLYMKDLRESGLSDSTIQSRMRALKIFTKWMYKVNLLTQEREVTIPRVSQEPPEILTDEQIHKLLSYCNLRNQVIILMLLDTGMRRSELASLHWQDIRDDGSVLIRSSKSRKPRMVFMGKKCHLMLLEWRITHPDNPVFGLKGCSIGTMLRRLSEKAGIECSPHTFRKCFATRCLQSGMSLYEVKELLGHSSYAMVQYYARLVRKDLARAHKKHGPVDKLKF